MKVADSLSRIWTLEGTPDRTGKITHLAGILVKVPFKPGSIISPADIIEQLETATSALVRSSCDPIITKGTQTDQMEPIQTYVLEPNEPIEADIRSVLGVHKISVSTNTGTREGTKNPKPRPEINDRKNITILTIKMELSNEINKALSPENYIDQQKEEFPKLHEQLIAGTAPKNFNLSQGLILIRHNKIWVRYAPKSLRNFLILRLHLLGHYASPRLIKVISSTDFWAGLNNDVKDFTQKCLSCLFIRGPRGPRESLGVPLSSRNCTVFQMDGVSGLPTVENKSFFVSVIDVFSRFTVTFPLFQDRSAEIAKRLEDNVFSIIGPCKFLVTDGAKNMAASTNIQELCAHYNITLKIRTPYSSRSLGTCERVHRSILEGIRSLTDTYDTNWVRALPMATLVYNSMPHSALGGYSPYEVFLGRPSPLVDKERIPNTPPANYTESYTEHQHQLRAIRKAVHKVNKEYKEKIRNRFGGEPKWFLPGQFVLSENKTPSLLEKKKLRPRYHGPFIIHEVLTKAVIAESVITGRLTYLNKDLIRLIPEKDVETYKNLPSLAKLKLGGGHKYEDWLQLWAEGTLIEEFNRSRDDPAYGEEGPLYPENFAGSVNDPEGDPMEEPGNEPFEAENSSSEESEPPQIPSNSQTMPRQVHFSNDLPTRRSNRTIRAPSRLDL